MQADGRAFLPVDTVHMSLMKVVSLRIKQRTMVLLQLL